MAEDVMLQEAIEALRGGQRGRARDLLTRLLRADQSNPQYWLWMSAAVDTPKEQVFCLQSVLRLEPNHEQAKQGLILLGALPPDETTPLSPQLRRDWEAPFQDDPIEAKKKKTQALTMVGGIVLVAGLIAIGIFGLRLGQQSVALRPPTHTAGPAPTFTPTPTFVNAVVKTEAPTPTPAGPEPLWMQLEATYTATPLYVNTPHPEEAYRTAMRAFSRQEWEDALNYLRQVEAEDAGLADIPYYIAEVYRLQRQLDQALASYDQALEIDPQFAPAHLGRARTLLAQNPKADVSGDLESAIQADPNLAEAYLERAEYSLAQGQTEAALADLDKASQLLPNSPWLYDLQAQALIQQGEYEQALEASQQALDLDLTYLPAYRVSGEAALLNGGLDQAVQNLVTYTTYQEDDPTGWILLARSYMQAEQYAQAEAAFTRAETSADTLSDSARYELYLYRGLAKLESKKFEAASQDLRAAYQISPRSYQVNLALGRASLAVGNLGDAGVRLDVSWQQAETDPERAAVLYWRAQLHEANGNARSALLDWQALSRLPAKGIPPEWLETARQRSAPTATPTPTKTLAPTPTQTRVSPAAPIKSPTPASRPSQTQASTVSPTKTKTALPTPNQTRTQTTVTPTPRKP